jgi:hypothetical protein
MQQVQRDEGISTRACRFRAAPFILSLYVYEMHRDDLSQ